MANGGIDLTAAMDGLAAAVQAVLTGTGHAYAWPVEAVRAGDAVVGYPQDPIEVALTFGRGADRAVFPVFAICGLPQDKATRDAIADIVTAASDWVAAIQSASGVGSYALVRDCVVDAWNPDGRPMQMAVRFNVEVVS